MRLLATASRFRFICWPLSALCLLTPLALASPALAQDQPAAPGQRVRIEVGTVVDLVFENAVTPASVSVGQTVTLKVANPVKVNNVVVIDAGATAIGEVTRSEKAGSIGKPAAIGVTLKQVTAVDGTAIPLSGTKMVEGENKQTSSLVITLLCCILGLLQKGGSAEIAAGATVRATVAAPVEVTGR